jgi:hypothetical protein
MALNKMPHLSRHFSCIDSGKDGNKKKIL